jgi:hypothetical protein
MMLSFPGPYEYQGNACVISQQISTMRILLAGFVCAVQLLHGAEHSHPIYAPART